MMDRSNMRRLSRQASLTTSIACPSERRYPEKRRRLITIEEARKEVFNRYKIPSKAVQKSETIDYQSLEALFFDRRETSLTIDGFEDEELAGLAFLDE